MKEREVAARLSVLKADKSVRAFAAECGVDYRRLATWLRGLNAPDAENLRRIAKRTGASVDWLLGISGARMLREQSREPAQLNADLGAYLAQELTKRYPPNHPLDTEPQGWFVHGPTALALILESLDGTAKRAHETRARALASRAAAEKSLGAADLLVERGIELGGLEREEGRSLIQAAGHIMRAIGEAGHNALDDAEAVLKSTFAYVLPLSVIHPSEEASAATSTQPKRTLGKRSRGRAKQEP